MIRESVVSIGCCFGALLLLMQGFHATPACSGPCPAETVGVSVAEWDTGLFAFDCRGIGQVFRAPDTLISSITIWRPAEEETTLFARRLFITDVDASSGVPLLEQVLLVGPELRVLAGDGVHPVEYRYAFDPPFVLPRRGLFFFAILAEGFGTVNILGTERNLYPDGRAWETGPDLLCIPSGAKPIDPNLDLVFEIEFCNTGTTPVRRRSWGELKIRYH